MKEAKKTLLRVIGIMWGLAAVVLIVGAILFAIHPFPYFPYVSGEVLGTLVSGLLMWHRFNTLDVGKKERHTASSYAGVGTKSDQPADIIIEFLFSTVFLPGYGVCGIVCHQGGGTPVSGHFPGKTGSGGINYTQTFV